MGDRVSKEGSIFHHTFIKVDDTHVRVVKRVIGLPFIRFSKLIDVQNTHDYHKCFSADEFLQYAYIAMDFNYE